MKPKVVLEKDIIEKYKKYENKVSKFKAYKMNQQVFEIDQNYEPQAIMGEGAYGMVVAALDNNKSQMVAIKKIIKPFEHKMFARRTLRELKLLRLIKHPNIMAVKTVILPKNRENFDDIYVVSELMETDLMTLIKSDQQLTEDHWKFFMFQILQGLNCLHKSNVIHRDLKPRNLLVNKDCDVKICDFGLARVVDPKIFASSSYVATRWYRAPELLLGYSKYTSAIDMWSVGVIFAQLILRKSFLPGYSTRDQVEKICAFFGRESLQVIKQISEQGKKIIKALPMDKKPKSFEQLFSKVSPVGLDLLKKLLSIDHEKRITAQEALYHPYFKDFEYQKAQFEPVNLNEFEFELYDFTTQQLKDIIYEQILLYHYKDFLKQYEDKKKKNQSLYKSILINSNAKLIDEEFSQPSQ